MLMQRPCNTFTRLFGQPDRIIVLRLPDHLAYGITQQSKMPGKIPASVTQPQMQLQVHPLTQGKPTFLSL
jgi:hypothetical protein